MATGNTNSVYNDLVSQELRLWQAAMCRRPNFWNRTTKNVQKKVNSIIPEKIHKAITKAIKEITRAVIFGSSFTTRTRKAV
ncbi:MAG: EcsC family protein, partial [Bacteroidota bacterium]